MTADVQIADFCLRTLESAELRLGFKDRGGLPVRSRLLAVLEGAMERPAEIDPATYSVLYALHECGEPTSSEETID